MALHLQILHVCHRGHQRYTQVRYPFTIEPQMTCKYVMLCQPLQSFVSLPEFCEMSVLQAKYAACLDDTQRLVQSSALRCILDISSELLDGSAVRCPEPLPPTIFVEQYEACCCQRIDFGIAAMLMRGDADTVKDLFDRDLRCHVRCRTIFP